MFGHVYHTGYMTDDVARAVAFYEQKFGGQLLKQVSQPDGTKMAFVKFGESEVELIEPGDKSRLGGKTGLIIDHVGYYVADLDKAMAELKAKGVKFGAGPTTSAMGYRMIFVDTDVTLGARIHLTEEK